MTNSVLDSRSTPSSPIPLPPSFPPPALAARNTLGSIYIYIYVVYM